MSEQECWQAVASRARQADGAFVYAVSTTGVYCRPSCPSRRPRRENVHFFPLPEAAERAGYRPCRRCRPQEQTLRDPARSAASGSGKKWTFSRRGRRLGQEGRQ